MLGGVPPRGGCPGWLRDLDSVLSSEILSFNGAQPPFISQLMLCEGAGADVLLLQLSLIGSSLFIPLRDCYFPPVFGAAQEENTYGEEG